ncbi:MAG: NUDIX domain-containing protein [Chloroflexota bacterium]|nr:NUDIX domain-containing protein [Chloroflexota bacterium]
MPACAAVIFAADQEHILLTRRSDNGRWCLPGGAIEAGESAAEACAREVREETGLEVAVGRLIGVYTTPHRIVEYDDGNQRQLIAFCFAATPTGGVLGLSDETTEAAYFAPSEIADLDLVDHHWERISDALAGQRTTFVR